MKRFLVLAVLMVSSIAVRAQWQGFDVGEDVMLMDVCGVSHDVVVACGENGTIVKSVDRGEHWEQKFADESIWYFQSIAFCDESNGYAYGYQVEGDGALVKTTDGGETWTHTLYNLPDYGWSNAKLFLVDVDTLFLFAGGELWKSCNGGYHFERIEYEASHSGIIYNWVENLYFHGNVGCMVIYDEDFGRIEILRSSDFGATWDMPFQLTVADEFSSFDYLFASQIVDDNTVRLFVYTEEEGTVVYETTNGFETYAVVPVHGFYTGWLTYHDGYFANNGKEGCLTGSYADTAVAIVTFDGGYSWEEVSDGLEAYYRPQSITGIDSVYYIAASHGRVYKLEGCHPNAVVEKSDKAAVYPNPTTGQLHIAAEGLQRLTVYSVLGQLVYEADFQSDEAEIDLSRFVDGVYLVRMVTSDGVQLRRVTVVK